MLNNSTISTRINRSPRLDFRAISSLPPSLRFVISIIFYGILGFIILYTWVTIRNGDTLPSTAIPCWAIPLVLFLILMSKSHFIAEENNIIAYNSLLNLKFNRKIYPIEHVRLWTLRSSMTISHSFKSTDMREREGSLSRNYMIIVADDRGERVLFSDLLDRQSLISLFNFMQSHYPKVACVNQLNMEEERVFDVEEKRSSTILSLAFLSFAIFFGVVALVALKNEMSLFEQTAVLCALIFIVSLYYKRIKYLLLTRKAG